MSKQVVESETDDKSAEAELPEGCDVYCADATDESLHIRTD